jgi:predicted O-methyltransferase YrrM
MSAWESPDQLRNTSLLTRQRVRQYLPPALLELYRRMRGRARVQDEHTLRSLNRNFLLPSRELDDLFPGASSVEIAFPAVEIQRAKSMVLPLGELLTIAAICRQRRPKRVFEIGTFTGATSLLIAMNIGADDELLTLDLPITDTLGYTAGAVFAATPYARKITQLYGDSRQFDFSPWYGTIDLVFIDANHTYPFVKADTEAAFRLLAPGGVVVWDDYIWLPEYPECAGVSAYLHELSARKACFQLPGMRLAVHLDEYESRPR